MPERRRQRRRKPELGRRLAAAGRRLSRLTRGEAIAVLAAILLLAFTFFDWYGYEQGGGLLVKLNLFDFPANAWDKLEVVPWFLLLTVLVALGMAVLRIRGSSWQPAIPPSAAVAVLGGLATLAILFRIVSPPDTVEIKDIPITITVEYGAYLALAAAAGIAYGGYRAMGERGTSFSKVAESLANEQPRAPRKDAPQHPRRPERSASKRRSRSSSD